MSRLFFNATGLLQKELSRSQSNLMAFFMTGTNIQLFSEGGIQNSRWKSVAPVAYARKMGRFKLKSVSSDWNSFALPCRFYSRWKGTKKECLHLRLLHLWGPKGLGWIVKISSRIVDELNLSPPEIFVSRIGSDTRRKWYPGPEIKRGIDKVRQQFDNLDD